MRSGKWLEPNEALPQKGARGDVLTEAQVIEWREHGFALVDGVFPPALLAQARDDALAVFPRAGSDAADVVNDFGSSGKMEFPAASGAVNDLTLHPRLLRAVAQLLAIDTLELRLTQSDLWPKYGRTWKSGGESDNTDQRMHVDYPNHTLVHPPPWDRPEAVELLVYLSDRAASGGATALVARAGAADPGYCWPVVHTPGVGALEWRNDRAAAEAYLERQAPEVAKWRAEHLYPREVMADYRMGTVLFYRHDTWHRGTPLAPSLWRGYCRHAIHQRRRPESMVHGSFLWNGRGLRHCVDLLTVAVARTGRADNNSIKPIARRAASRLTIVETFPVFAGVRTKRIA
ncbi:MAG: phytanoyl-CoA dioxygenase family protein [Gammaproteobacteria bacterium]